MSTKTLGPTKSIAPPSRPSQQLGANEQINARMMEMLRKEQGRLTKAVDMQIADQRQSPFAGETVLYRLNEGPSAGEQRPAIVVCLLEGEGDTTRCVLKVLCNPDLDGIGVMDEPNVKHGPGLNEWLPNDPRIQMKDPELEDRVPVGDA